MTVVQQFVLDTLYSDNSYVKKRVTILINCILSETKEEQANELVDKMLTALIVNAQIVDD